jgi:hypothetical protein
VKTRHRYQDIAVPDRVTWLPGSDADEVDSDDDDEEEFPEPNELEPLPDYGPDSWTGPDARTWGGYRYRSIDVVAGMDWADMPDWVVIDYSRFSCLGAGTKVWTDMGRKVIEEVQVGDRVLSQHPRSGELAYRPVLQTSIRPASRLVVLHAGGSSIVASEGHLFWVSGDGWLRACDARGGMELHALDGTVQLSRVEAGRFEPAYNLVVADFHTFFVGDEKPVLCHDNTDRRKTDAVVPGLIAR